MPAATCNRRVASRPVGLVTTLMQLAGVVLLVAAAFVIAPVLGVAAAGGALLSVGWLLDRPAPEEGRRATP